MTPQADWDPRPGESPGEFRLFSLWLTDSGSLADFAKRNDLSPATLYTLNRRHHWRGRKAAFERQVHQDRVESARDTARTVGAEHAQAASLLLEWSVDSIVAARARGEELDQKHLVTALKTAVELGRLIAGEATSRVESVSAWDHLSPEQLQALEAALDD